MLTVTALVEALDALGVRTPVATGKLVVRPYTALYRADSIVTAESFDVDLKEGASFVLEPEIYYVIGTRDIAGLSASWLVLAPDLDTISLSALVTDHRVDPASLDPVEEPQAAWWLEVQEQIDGAHLEVDDLVLEKRNGGTVNVGNVRGTKGDKGDVGPAGMQWRGAYNPAIDYVLNDAVAYQGTTWFAAVNPPVGETPSTASTYWQQMAVQGSQGDIGPIGPKGDKGDQGNQGNPGDYTPAITGGNVGNTTIALPADSAYTRRFALNGPVTLTLASGTSGSSYTITLTFQQISPGGYAVTWPTNVLWPEGIVPQVGAATTGGVTLVHFLWDGSTRWLGVIGGTNFA